MTDHDPIETMLARLDRPVSPSPDFARALRARVIAEAGAESDQERQPDGDYTTMQTLTALPASGARERREITSKRWIAGLEIAAAVLLLLGAFAALGGVQPVRDRFAGLTQDQGDDASVPLGPAAMYGGDAGRTGQQPGPAPEYEFVDSWVLGIEGRYVAGSAPVALGDTVYRVVTVLLGSETDGSATTILESIDSATGERRWQTTADIIGSPAVTADLVFVNVGPVRVGTPDPTGASLARLQAFDARTGALVWSVPTGKISGWSSATSPLVIGDTVYAAAPNGTVFAVEGRTGRIVWTATEGVPADDGDESGTGSPPITATGQIAGNTHALFVVTPSGQLLALDRETGAKHWAIDIADRFQMQPESVEPLVVKDLVILRVRGVDQAPSAKNAGSVTDMYAVLEAGTGENLWRRNFPILGSTPTVAASLLIVPTVGTISNEIVAVDLSSGEDVWTRPWITDMPRGVSVVGDSLFFSGADNRLNVLNTENSNAWHLPTETGIVFPAVVTNQRIVLQDEAGTLMAFSANPDDASPIADEPVQNTEATVSAPEPTPPAVPTRIPASTPDPREPTVVPPGFSSPTPVP